MSRVKRGTQAAGADRYALYQQSVQQPNADIAFIERVFRGYYGKPPLSLREDFCGTANLACRWAASRPDRTAIGVDLDPEPLAWGREHNLAVLADDARARVELVESDVLAVDTLPVNAVMAGNFSFCVFGTRPLLLRYFRNVREHLAGEGVFVMDVLGGPEIQRADHEWTRDELSFHYVWHQRSFNPVTNHAEFSIHFRFVDGSELADAFTYDWRMWTLPELQELLEEAGFAQVDVYWEMLDPSNGTNTGVFRRVRRAPAAECWLAEVVAFP